MNNLHLIPQPKSVTLREGCFRPCQTGYISLDSRDLYDTLVIARQAHFAACELLIGRYAADPVIAFERDMAIHKEGYVLTVGDGIIIRYSTPQGAFYGCMTLNQLMNGAEDGAIPCCVIEDEPALPVRGYMLDIARNKVPKTEEIFRLIDKLAALKINHMEMYMEWVPFKYPSFPQMWEGRDLMCGEDIMAIDRYCRDRFIELVPNQNNFGHMDAWLKKEFNHLAECPDGFPMGNGMSQPRCLDPQNPESEALVAQLADDLLPYFTSDKYNICCDETIELGKGKNREAVEKLGLGRVYTDFLKKVIAIAQKHGKTPLFWDDVIRDFPEMIGELPKDAVVLEWGYGADCPIEKNCQMLHDLGVRFYLCPGINGWNSFLSKADEMLGNIRTAGLRALQYGAEGVLNTDWGDGGHLNFISTSYVGIAWGAAMSWRPEENKDIDLAAAVDTHVYRDRAGKATDFTLKAGHFFLLEGEQPQDNTTLTHRFMMTGLKWRHLCAGLDRDAFDNMVAYFEGLRPLAEGMDIATEEGDLIKREFLLSLDACVLLQNVGLFYVACHKEDAALRREALEALKAGIPQIVARTEELWLVRNRRSYLAESVTPWKDLLDDVEKELAVV